MNRRMTSVLAVALVAAAAASFLVYRIFSAQVADASHTQTSEILFASRNLETGTVIKEADLQTGKWLGSLPGGVLLKKDAAVGRGVITPIYQGEAVLESRLALPGAGGGLAATIPAGMRACAVKVNEVVGLAGFVVSGMRVDVLVTGNPAGTQYAGTPRTKTVLQNVEVLSAGQNFQRDAEGKPVQVQVVNLLVTPDQAEMLSLASTEARIQLVLRNPLDKEMAKTEGTSVPNLFGNASSPKPATAAPRAPRPPRIQVQPLPPAPEPAKTIYVVEVLNGAQRSETKFQEAATRQ